MTDTSAMTTIVLRDNGDGTVTATWHQDEMPEHARRTFDTEQDAYRALPDLVRYAVSPEDDMDRDVLAVARY